MSLNINPLKELLVLIMGPVFQNLAYFILLFLFDYDLVNKYHLGILIFNLLPIYPLDGGKLLNIFFTKILPYKTSYKLVIIVSYIMTIIILISSRIITINVIITYIFLVYIIRKEQLKTDFLYNKFLLERYLNNYNYKKIKIVNNINNLYRTKNNIINDGNKYYYEREILEKKYNKI